MPASFPKEPQRQSLSAGFLAGILLPTREFSLK